MTQLPRMMPLQLDRSVLPPASKLIPRLLRRLLPLVCVALGAPALAQTPLPTDGRLYAPGSFERLEVGGNAQVRLRQGDRDEVWLAGDSQMQRSVEISLNGDLLQIRPMGDWKFWARERPQIEVMMRKLSQLVLSGAGELQASGPLRTPLLLISISGSGQVDLQDLQAEDLTVAVAGSGDAQLRGQVSELSLKIGGKGRVDAEHLHSRRARVSVGGVGEVKLWTQSQLSVSVAGLLNLDYWGSPQLRVRRAGFANLTAHGDKPAPAQP